MLVFDLAQIAVTSTVVSLCIFYYATYPTKYLCLSKKGMIAWWSAIVCKLVFEEENENESYTTKKKTPYRGSPGKVSG